MCRPQQRRQTEVASSSTPVINTPLLNRIALKSGFEFQAFDLSCFEPTPLREAPKPVIELPAQVKEVDNHIIVQHNYHDHSNDVQLQAVEDQPARGGVSTPFPLKLHEMLEGVEAGDLSHVVSWQPHGRCFVVHKPKEFEKLLPQYFKQSKLPSFQRQLNLYGFQRLTHGRDKGGYYHELFLRNKVFLAHSIMRMKVKGTGVRARSNPDQEPNFWSMNWVETSAAPVEDSKAQDWFAESKTDDVFDFEPLDANSTPNLEGMDQLLAGEAESFFDEFEFPDEIEKNLEDDDVFGDMLEEMCS